MSKKMKIYSNEVFFEGLNKKEALDMFQGILALYSKDDTDKTDVDNIHKLRRIISQIKEDAKQVYDKLDDKLQDILNRSCIDYDEDAVYEMVYGENNSILSEFQSGKMTFKHLFSIETIDDFNDYMDDKKGFEEKKGINGKYTTESYDKDLSKIDVDSYLR